MREFSVILFFISLFSFPKILLSQSSSNQAGNLVGVVMDSKSGELLIGVTALIKETNEGAATDIDGRFEIRDVKAGQYHLQLSYVSYKNALVPITVKAGRTDTLHFTMESNVQQITGVTVGGVRITNTENSVLNEIKKSDVVISGISGAQIAKTKDRDAADVVKRIPGVSILDDRFIMVRGLSDRYNSVWLNGAGAPSAEVDKKSFSFDVIPSGLIDRILIFKTPAPDLPGDFAGGMVKIYTKAFPTTSQFVFNVEGSYRAGTTGKPFYYTQGSSTDWLGFDNGYRSIPLGVLPYASKNDPDNEEYSKSFPNNWGILQKNASPDLRLNAYYSKIFKGTGFQIGNTTGIFYTSAYETYTVRRQEWDSVAPVYDYEDLQSTRSIRSGLLENISYLSGNTKLEFKNFLNQTGVDETVQRTSILASAPNEKSYLEQYEARTTYSGQFAGGFKSNSEKTEYTFTLGYDYTSHNTPDLRRITYTKQQDAPDSLYKAQVANIVDPVHGGGLFFSNLKENLYSFNQNLKQKISISHYHFDLNVGSYIEYKDRKFDSRTLGYTITPGFQAFNLTRLPLNEIFAPENVGGDNTFRIDEITSPSDKYKAKNQLYACYVSLNLPAGKHFNVLTGARGEYNIQSLQGFVNLDSISPSVKTFYILPSLNATYNFNKKNLLRFAYGETLNRPEFREWSPFYFYDFIFRAGTYGSLFPTVYFPNGDTLKVAQIQNLDLRYELYPAAGETFQIGVFYKHFKDPIQEVVIVSSGSDSKAFTFVNADHSYSAGIELDVRKNLAFLDTILNTRWLHNISVVGNATFIKSQLTITQTAGQIENTPLQGQSPYMFNAGLFYDDDSMGWHASLVYNVFGPRVDILGTAFYPNIIEMPWNSLDVTVAKDFGKHLSLNASVQNLINQAHLLIQDTNRDGKYERNGVDRHMEEYKEGCYFSLGAKLTF